MSTLTALPGIGNSLARRISNHFGGDEHALRIINDGEASRLSEVEGLSLKRSLEIVRSQSGSEFLATDEAKRIHAELMESIAEFATSQVTRDRIRMLQPGMSLTERIELISEAMKCTITMGKICSIVNVNKRYDRVIVSRKSQSHLEKFCRVLSPSKEESWGDYRVFKKVTWVGEGGPTTPPNGWIVLPADSNDKEKIPEMTIDWFSANRTTLESILNIDADNAEFSKRLQQVKKSILPLKNLYSQLDDSSKIDEIKQIKDKLWTKADELQTSIEERVAAEVKEINLDLSGEDMLEALADQNILQRKLANMTSDSISIAIQDAVDSLKEFIFPSEVNIVGNPFTNGWPTKVDRKTLDNIDSQLEKRISQLENDKSSSLVKQLSAIKENCETAIREAIELDVWLTIARWGNHNSCTMPTLSEHGIAIEEGRHLLLGCEPTPITYGLGRCASKGDSQSIALLTGANSGGKTTLLETLAHISILANSGLPVPAKKANVAKTESLHILAKAGGTQSAGALEQTLLQLAEVVSDDSSKLILADELEAITEPGAGARIIAGMLKEAESHSQTTMLLVTHLAPAIIAAMDKEIRTDGIEASGLDENLELIVDRTPKRNHLAKSTPELIVKRLIQRSNNSRIFSEILAMFSQ